MKFLLAYKLIIALPHCVPGRVPFLKLRTGSWKVHVTISIIPHTPLESHGILPFACPDMNQVLILLLLRLQRTQIKLSQWFLWSRMLIMLASISCGRNQQGRAEFKTMRRDWVLTLLGTCVSLGFCKHCMISDSHTGKEEGVPGKCLSLVFGFELSIIPFLSPLFNCPFCILCIFPSSGSSGRVHVIWLVPKF
jgi:hypothetical protein